MADQAIQLVVRKGPRPGQVFPLTQEAMSIGRDPLSDIVLDDPEVSRQHARLTRIGEGYHLQDVGSTNGTFVDGQRLKGEAVPLKPGQVIMMGSNVTLIAQATSESDPLATMIAPSIEAPEAEPMPPEPVAPEPEFEAPSFETPPPVEEMAEAVEEAVPEELDMATMLEPEPFAAEELESETEALPAYEEAEPFPPEPEMATPFPPELEPEPEDATELLPAFEEPFAPEPLPSFEEAPPPPSFEEPEPEPMPSFEEPPKFDSGEPMGEFEPEPPPPPPPPDAGEVKQPNPNRNRNIIIAVVVILLLCCCCLIIAAVLYLVPLPVGSNFGSFGALLPVASSAHIA